MKMMMRINLNDKTFQNPLPVSCLMDIPDFESLLSLLRFPEFKALS